MTDIEISHSITPNHIKEVASMITKKLTIQSHLSI